MAVEQEPTQSQQTNRLIALCREVEAGRVAPGELKAYLDQRRSGLEEARTDFMSRSSAEGEDFLRAVRPQREAVLEQFEQQARGMAEIARFFEDGDPGHLRAGVAGLIESTPQMLAALATYEAAYMIAGPTRHPMVNILAKTIPNVLNGNFPRDEFERMLSGAVETFGKAIAELDASPLKDHPGIPERRAGFEQVIAGVKRMQRWQQDGDSGHLDEGLRMVEQAHDVILDALQKFEQAQFTGHPTTSPMVNWVINAAEGVKSGQYPAQILGQALDWLEAEFRKIRETFERTAETPTTSAMIQEELPRTMEAFDLQEEAIQKLRASLSHPIPAVLDAGIAALKEAVERLNASQAVYEQAGEREGKLVCPQCGRPNAPENRRCDQCGFSLPRVMDLEFTAGAQSTFEVREAQGAAEPGDEMVMTTHLKRIFDAAEAIHAGKISSDEFLQVLDWGEGLVREAEGQMADLPPLDIQEEDIPEEERDAFHEQKALAEETKDLLRRGIEEFRQGLEQMRGYVDRPDQNLLVGGIKSIWEGARKLHQCQKMGEAVERLEAAEGGAPRSPAAPRPRPSSARPAAPAEPEYAPPPTRMHDEVTIEEEDD